VAERVRNHGKVRSVKQAMRLELCRLSEIGYSLRAEAKETPLADTPHARPINRAEGKGDRAYATGQEVGVGTQPERDAISAIRPPRNERESSSPSLPIPASCGSAGVAFVALDSATSLV
jgi:hypothetical protein